MLGEGFTFLNIPRSYYGVLTKECFEEEKDIPAAMIAPLMKALETGGVTDVTGIVLDLNVSDAAIDGACSSVNDYTTLSAAVRRAVRKSRYMNLFKLLGTQINEEVSLDLSLVLDYLC